MVSVFKTNVSSREEGEILFPLLDQLLLPAGKWHFDFEDRDKVLRIECENEVTHQLHGILRNNGFTCDELQD